MATVRYEFHTAPAPVTFQLKVAIPDRAVARAEVVKYVRELMLGAVDEVSDEVVKRMPAIPARKVEHGDTE